MDETPTPTPTPTPPADPGIKITPAAKDGVKKVLTPEEKKAKRKAMLKRLAIISGVSYLVIMFGIILWALITGGEDVVIFKYLPISSEGFNNFLWLIFNLMLGVVVLGVLCVSLFGLIKSVMTKKEELEKKKKASKLAMFGGIGFFTLTVLWLVGVWFLGPKFVTEDRFGSPILTDPELTIGLTTPVTIGFDAGEIPVDTGVYSILSYAWDFGDGDTSTGETVTHKFIKKAGGDGIYTVTLDVTYMDLQSGAQFEDEFTVEVGIDNELAAATFTATPDSGEIPLTVKFDASASSDSDGEIVSYEWDMDGDGRYDDGEGEEVEYEFMQEGEFEVTVRVTDNNGEYDTYTKTIEAGSIGGLRAVISEDNDEGIYYVDETYSFTGEDSKINDGSITKYTWDFDDGNKVQSRSATQTWTESGFYDLVLTVEDANGNEDETTLEVEVVVAGSTPDPVIETDPKAEEGVVSGPVPFEVTFDGSGSYDADDDIIQYEWDFDNDGIADAEGDSVTYSFDEEGSYEASLIVTDSENNEAETSVEVLVGAQGVIARMEIDESNGEVPLTVAFDASGSSYKEGNIVSYEYDFGDGSDPYVGGSSVTYKYTDVGTFSASVTVYGEDGESDSKSIQIVVRPVSLTSCFTVNTDSGQAPLFVSVDPTCAQGTIDSYEWDFGDGEISFDRKPETHIYKDKGKFTITLEVTNKDGIVDSFNLEIEVK